MNFSLAPTRLGMKKKFVDSAVRDLEIENAE